MYFGSFRHRGYFTHFKHCTRSGVQASRQLECSMHFKQSTRSGVQVFQATKYSIPFKHSTHSEIQASRHRGIWCVSSILPIRKFMHFSYSKASGYFKAAGSLFTLGIQTSRVLRASHAYPFDPVSSISGYRKYSGIEQPGTFKASGSLWHFRHLRHFHTFHALSPFYASGPMHLGIPCVSRIQPS